MKRIGLVAMLLILTSCGNKDIGFGNYEFNYVSCQSDYLDIFNEPIVSWKDFEDGEQLEISLESGNNILVSSTQCFLSKDKVR